MKNSKSSASPQRVVEHIKPRKPYSYDNEINGRSDPDACPTVSGRDFPPVKPTDLPADIILTRLRHIRRRVLGNGPWQACCPAHADSSPSLSLAERSDGVLLVYCWAGCETERVLAELGMSSRLLYPSLFALQFGRPVRTSVAGFRGAGDAEDLSEPTDEDCAEWTRIHSGLDIPEFAINQLAVQFGLPQGSIRRLAVRYDDDENCWVLPERDDRSRIVGLVRRLDDGRKHAMLGGRRGLTIPDYGEPLPPGPLYIAEGASDTAALCSVGAFAIGRSAATVGALECLWLERLTRKHRDRDIVVLGDRDEDGCGEHQAAKLAERLAKALGRTVEFALPIAAFKDLREQVTAGKWRRGLSRKEVRPAGEDKL